MPSILKLQSLAMTDISESLFLGGTTLSDQTTTSFSTASGDFTVRFLGKNLTYDSQGMITGGKIEEYRLYQGAVEIADQVVIVDSNFTLLTGQQLAQVFALHAAGDAAAANRLVMRSWTQEPFSLTDYSSDDVHGTRTDDFLSSLPGGNIISGLAGSDLLLLGLAGSTGYGGTGNDFLYAGAGNDLIYGGSGNDAFFSHAARDRSLDQCFGGLGDDWMGGQGTLWGGLGNDFIGGGPLLYGGDGDDLLTAAARGATLAGGAGADVLMGGSGFDGLSGGTQNDTLRGHAGDDQIAGGSGDDLLAGGTGNDLVTGGAGDDTLYGAAGDDVLAGDGGDDWLFVGSGVYDLTGGTGRDHFVLTPDAGTGVVHDFQLGIDVLDLTRFAFADLAALEAVLSDTGTGDALFEFAGGQSLRVVGVLAADLLADVAL